MTSTDTTTTDGGVIIGRPGMVLSDDMARPIAWDDAAEETDTAKYTKGQPITFRNVQGRRTEGKVLSIHTMTGEVEVLTDKGTAYVPRDRILPTVTNQAEA